MARICVGPLHTSSERSYYEKTIVLVNVKTITIPFSCKVKCRDNKIVVEKLHEALRGKIESPTITVCENKHYCLLRSSPIVIEFKGRAILVKNKIIFQPLIATVNRHAIL